MSHSQLMAQCELAEARYLDEQYSSISDAHLLDFVLGMENEMETKRIADSQTETQAGILS